MEVGGGRGYCLGNESDRKDFTPLPCLWVARLFISIARCEDPNYFVTLSSSSSTPHLSSRHCHGRWPRLRCCPAQEFADCVRAAMSTLLEICANRLPAGKHDANGYILELRTLLKEDGWGCQLLDGLIQGEEEE